MVKFIMLILAIVLQITISSCGGDTLPDNKNSTPTQIQNHSWSKTDDGMLEYRWETNGACILRDVSGQMYISRMQPTGKVGQIVWEWTEEGKLILDVYKYHYTLDSPYNYVVNGYHYGTGAGGVLLGAENPIFLKKGYVVVYGYDEKHRPLDINGKVITLTDKYGQSLRLIDVDGNDVSINIKPKERGD